MDVKLHAILTWAPDTRECSASRFHRFTRRIGGCVGSRTGLDVVAKKKILSPTGNRNPVAASHCTDWATSAHLPDT
jgi:hypothetical protein